MDWNVFNSKPIYQRLKQMDYQLLNNEYFYKRHNFHQINKIQTQDSFIFYNEEINYNFTSIQR